MSAHFVTCDWGTTGWPMLSMTCEEPPESMCHAVWTCECEGWSSDGVDNGEPWHHHYEDLPHVRHVGKFDRAVCNWGDWFDGSDETMRGAIVFRVEGKWVGDGMEFRPVGAVKA